MNNKVEDTLIQRGNRYGCSVRNAQLTQTLMNEVNLASAREGTHLSAVHKEYLHMIMHKISRMVVGDPWYADNVHDIGGYAKLIEEYIIDTAESNNND